MTNGICRSINLKESKMAIPASEDTGFCSGEEEFSESIHSPTDSSEDSVEVRISPISLKNKRKCAEPRKVQDSFTGPLKKRMCLKVKAESTEPHPFRPWSPQQKSSCVEPKKIVPKIPEVKPIVSFTPVPSSVIPTPFLCQTKTEPPSNSYFRPPSPVKFCQTEPVSLVKKREQTEVVVKKECDILPDSPRVPIHPQLTTLSTAETERLILNTNEAFPALQSAQQKSENPRREQRNYKNMTRERRIEANARERTRVHTISAAFDTLRRSIPSYSHNQKLSKLSVLRIACSYIMTLSSIVNEDEETTAESVETVSRTIQREGKLRKKKDDND